MNEYIVTLRFKFPELEEGDGTQYEAQANDESEAIRKIRRQAMDDGLITARGAYWFTVKEAGA